MPPCSERYEEKFRLALDPSDIGKFGHAAAATLSQAFEIYGVGIKNYYIEIVRGDGDHPVVMQVTYPKGEISKTFNSWFRAEAGMSNGKAGCLQSRIAQMTS